MQSFINSIYLFTARFINSFAILGLILLISRRLGPEIFGAYSFLNAVVMTGIVMANFGLDTLMVREVSREKSLGKKYLASILTFKLLSSILVISGLYFFSRLFLHDQATIKLLVIFSIIICLNALSQSFWFYSDAFQQFRLHAGLWAFSNLLKLPIVWVFISFSQTLDAVILALVLAEMISLFFSGLWTHYYFGTFLNSLSSKFILHLIQKAWPFASIFILSAVYFRVDMIMLEFIKGDKAVGIYSAAYKLIEFLSIIPGTICVATLPDLSSDYSTSLDDFRNSSFKTIALLGGGGVLIGCAFYVFSEKIIFLLYGYLFFDSVFSLRILSWVIFFFFLNGYLAYVLIATNNEKSVALIIFFATILNVLFNYYLIPKYGPVGAAIATLLAEAIMLFFYGFLLVKKNIFLKQHVPLTPKSF